MSTSPEVDGRGPEVTDSASDPPLAPRAWPDDATPTAPGRHSTVVSAGIGAVTDDLALRDELQNLVEEMTGKQYPVPPPWP